MSRRVIVSLALLALLALTAACGPLSDSGCLIGPCTIKVGPYPMLMVHGLPASRVSGGDAHLAVGDTLRLVAVHVMSDAPLCQAIDTVRDSVRWGVTDSTVATIDANGLLRARGAGGFEVLMLVGGTTPITPALPPQYLPACPSGGLYAHFVVAP